MNKQNGRIIGLDVFRILSMCGIVGLHIMGNGGVLKNTNIYSYQYPVLLFAYSIFYLSVNSFALLSGYLSIEKAKVKYQRIIELLAVIIFFILIETAIIYTFNINNIRAEGYVTLLKGLFPFGVGYYWYITCYILLFFLIPYINKLTHNLTQKSYKKLITIGFILLCVLPNVFLQTDFFRIDNGYSALWLIYCYLVGGYIKLYPPKRSMKQCVLRLVLSLVVMTVFNYVWRVVGVKVFGNSVRDSWMISYTSPLNLYASVMVLIIFSRMNSKTRTTKIITSLSAASFAVYIFHDHYLFFNYILKDSFASIPSFNILVQVGIVLGGIIGVYTLGYLIDIIRVRLFKLVRLDKLIERIGTSLDRRMELQYEE